jgi:AcrR family transcriptional regulator
LLAVTLPRQNSSRQRLVEAAASLFYRDGIHRTSVDAIVLAAGLTKPTFYAHFPSKDLLVTAVMELRSENWREAMEERVASARTPRRHLLAVSEFLEDFIANDPFRGCALINAAVEIPDQADPSREVARRNKRENYLRLEQLARDARLRDPASLAYALSLLFEGALVVAYVEGKTDAGVMARKAAESLLRQHARPVSS